MSAAAPAAEYGTPGERASQAIVRAAVLARTRGLTEEEILRAAAVANETAFPPLPDAEVRSIAECIARLPVAPDVSQHLPDIVVNNRELRDVSRDALNALEAANNPPELFTRGAGLARIGLDEQRRPVIQQVGFSELMHHLARAANWRRTSINEKRESVFRSVSPPEVVGHDLINMPSWNFPPLVAVVETPVMRRDGTILTEPGYDSGTGLFYQPEPGLRVPAIPERPSAADVDAAKALIHEAIGEFPFADDSSYANAVALLLTPVARPLIDGCVPLVMIDKPSAGTGATLLAEALGSIVAGSTQRKINDNKSDEEWRKQITSTLLAGATVILIDNVENALTSSSLARVLTSRVWEDRVLGVSKSAKAHNRASWIVTGNNVKLQGDIARRTYWVRLDARVARPWQGRAFKHPDLMAWVQGNRGKLLAAALTLARAWAAEGMRPGPSDRMGSFEEWERTIGGILQHTGISGFLENLDRLYEEADQEDGQWEDFLAALRPHLPHAKGAILIARILQDDTALAELAPTVIAEKLDRPEGELAAVIGRQFSKREGKRFGDAGLYVVRGKNGTKKSSLWMIQGRE